MVIFSPSPSPWRSLFFYRAICCTFLIFTVLDSTYSPSPVSVRPAVYTPGSSPSYAGNSLASSAPASTFHLLQAHVRAEASQVSWRRVRRGTRAQWPTSSELQIKEESRQARFLPPWCQHHSFVTLSVVIG